MNDCPLCGTSASGAMENLVSNKAYRHCTTCHLIFALGKDFPALADEKERYLLHENDINNEGYVSFLSQIIDLALPYIFTNAKGLDFGCGYNPVLAQILENKGYACEKYDPIFFPEMPAEQFDYAFAVECFEHFFQPRTTIELLLAKIKPAGYLFIMTSLWTTEAAFAKWYYTRDPTHVAFFNVRTFEWMASEYNLSIKAIDKGRTIILQKQ